MIMSLSKIDNRNDGEVEVIDVKLNNRKTKKIGDKKQASDKSKKNDSLLATSISEKIVTPNEQKILNDKHQIKSKT